MKVLTTEGLTKLIQLIKSSFISSTDVVTTNTVTLSTVATSGSFNDLTDRPNAYIVETYGHYDEHGFGTESWYRLWSDGFLEQGGKITPSADANAISITFLKTYDYLPTVVTTVHYNQGSYTANTSNCTNRNATLWACTIGNTSTSGFVVNRGGTNWDINWRATGYVPIVA